PAAGHRPPPPTAGEKFSGLFPAKTKNNPINRSIRSPTPRAATATTTTAAATHRTPAAAATASTPQSVSTLRHPPRLHHHQHTDNITIIISPLPPCHHHLYATTKGAFGCVNLYGEGCLFAGQQPQGGGLLYRIRGAFVLLF
nr:hypothetical protein [Tanacetum cinerariifolium]